MKFTQQGLSGGFVLEMPWKILLTVSVFRVKSRTFLGGFSAVFGLFSAFEALACRIERVYVDFQQAGRFCSATLAKFVVVAQDLSKRCLCED